MRRNSVILFFLLIFSALGAFAQEGVEMHFPSLGGDASVYVAPPGPGKHPALIVVHEWWGLDPWIQAQVDRFAEQGYFAVAPDLYRGKVAKTPEEAHELMRGLPQDRAMADLKATVDWVSKRVEVDPSRIGVIGWCMGGGYALDLALADPRINATVINYGHLVADPNAVKALNGPLLGNFGEKDLGIPPKDVHVFEEALEAAHKAADIKIYGGAGHAFMNPNNKEGYVKEAATDAWKRIDAFLAKNLKPRTGRP
jgi:carboxymethylenebutenolidase